MNTERPTEVRLFRSLGFRLAVAIGVSLGLGLVAFLVTSMTHHENALLKLKQEEASLLADTIQGSLTHAMRQGEGGRQAIHRAIHDVSARQEIERVRIFNAVGRIQYSSDSGETGTVVDKSAESCVQCHTGEASPGRRVAKRTRFFYTPSGTGNRTHRVLGILSPIYNDRKSCTPCHDSKTTVLGVLDVSVSLENLDADIRLHRSALVVFGILGVGLIIAIAAFAIHILIQRPIAELVAGTQKIGRLDLDYRIPEERKDELGNLAASFNDMTSRLKKAQEKIQSFTDGLERKVEEKSRELQAAQLSMLRAEKMAAIGQMAAGVAHEINNPLTGVITFATLLKRRCPDDERFREDLDTIIEEAYRCAKIARGLLDFARGGTISPHRADITRVLERTMALVEKQAIFHDIETVRSYEPDLPEVLLDEDRMGQVFLNLVMNAAEFMPEGGRLTLAARRIENWDGRGEAVRVEVGDTGPGIPPDLLSRVFEPFFTTKEPGEGTGLGLAVSFGIVEDHGGVIKVASELGKGATFTVILPVSGEEE